MGQVFVTTIPSGSATEFLERLRARGIDVSAAMPGTYDRRHVCAQGGHVLQIELYEQERSAHETFVVMAHPPYSWRPWRWARDYRLFNDVCSVLDEVELTGGQDRA
jgi:hypothetical protein